MKNSETMEDYLRWRGDLSFEESHLNDCDSAIFCEIAYVDFSNVLSRNMDPIPLREAISLLDALEEEDRKEAYGEKEELIHQIGKTDRFGLVNVVEYEDEPEDAFAAMEFELDEETSFLAFRGSESSELSLVEDFLLSITKTHEQEDAEQYAWGIMKETKQYYFGGHGAGGNLAVYAASSLNTKRQERLLGVYMLDAPGFSKEIFDENNLVEIRDKMISIVPDYCLVGKIFPFDLHEETIVQTTTCNIFSHDMTSWCMEGNNFVKVEENDIESIEITNLMDEFTDHASYDARSKFIEEIFISLDMKDENTGPKLLQALKQMKEAKG